MLLVTADDRTGALETGGACADLGLKTRLVRVPTADDDCAVMDLDCRHCAPAEAQRRVAMAHRRAARFRCHKMDSGLRGNWAHEVAALVEAGHRVGLLASFPDAGRRCHDGTVFIHDVPVAESAFGRDPRNRLLSSRPVDHLIAAGCATALEKGALIVLDADTNDELNAAAKRCLDEQRLLVGTTGGIGAYAAAQRQVPMALPMRRCALPRPALVVCGSLHPLSRVQIAALGCSITPLDAADQALATLASGTDAALATATRATAIGDAEAEATAANLARTTWRILAASGAPTLIVLGGDTAAAILGDRELRILGSVDVGVPLAMGENDKLHIVAKGGGIGTPETLQGLLPPRLLAPRLLAPRLLAPRLLPSQ